MTFMALFLNSWRNDALDARDYFTPGPKVPLKLNQFGVNLSPAPSSKRSSSFL